MQASVLLLDSAEAAIGITDETANLESAAHFGSPFAIELALRCCRLRIDAAASMAFSDKSVTANRAFFEGYFFRIAGFLATVSWFFRIFKGKITANLIVEEIDIELGGAFDNKAFGIPANECFTLVFQIVFAGKDGVSFRR